MTDDVTIVEFRLSQSPFYNICNEGIKHELTSYNNILHPVFHPLYGES